MAPRRCWRQYIAGNPDEVPPIKSRIRVAIGMAQGLGYIHSKGGVPHYDLSVRNLLLLLFDTADYRVKLCDFGASILDRDAGRQHDGT